MHSIAASSALKPSCNDLVQVILTQILPCRERCSGPQQYVAEAQPQQHTSSLLPAPQQQQQQQHQQQGNEQQGCDEQQCEFPDNQATDTGAVVQPPSRLHGFENLHMLDVSYNILTGEQLLGTASPLGQLSRYGGQEHTVLCAQLVACSRHDMDMVVHL